MKEIETENILESLEQIGSVADKVLLLRLYEEYKRQKLDTTAPTLIKMMNAYDNINKKIKNLNKREDYYYSQDVNNEIIKLSKLLDSCMLNYNIKNKKQLQKTIDLITYLESFLKLDISFRDDLEHCIESIIEKNRHNSKKLQK